MPPYLLWSVVVVVVLIGAVLVARQLPFPLGFYYRLFRAQQQANRFYAEFPYVTKNVAYHPNMPRRLDVYQPETGAGHPVIVFVYGGSWASGNKELYAPAAQRFLPEGFVLVVPDYTLYPAAGFPQQTEEIAAAIAWTLDHIADYGGDPGRVVLAAQSAGAQISSLVILEPKWLEAHGHTPTEVRGFIGISGVYDFSAMLAQHGHNARARELLIGVLGGVENAAAASPISFVSPQAPPTLLIHGDADTTVPLSVAGAFDQRLREAGVASELVVYPGAGHADILFRALTERPPRLFNDIFRFAGSQTARAENTLESPGMASEQAAKP